MNILKYLTALLVIFFLSCEEIENYPNKPQVKFKKMVFVNGYDALDNPVKLGTFTFKLIDGDGDVGLKESDTSGPYQRDSIYYYNLYMTLFKKEQGEFKEVKTEVDHNFRLPYVEPKGQNNTVQATVEVEITYPIDQFPYDTVAYEFYFFDRALRKSNVEFTGDIPVNPAQNNLN